MSDFTVKDARAPKLSGSSPGSNSKIEPPGVESATSPARDYGQIKVTPSPTVIEDHNRGNGM